MSKNSMIDGFERRGFLRSLAGGAATISLGSGASMFAPIDAQAQSSDYKALVCLFLFGGNDGMNMVVPMDDSVAGSGYSQYSSVRGALALPSNALQPLSNSRFGLHPGLAPLTSVWDDNAMAVVHNVGPLAKPMTQAQYVTWRKQNDASLVPESLFSHSDQQRQWENAATTTISQTGWGGLAAEQNDFNQVVSFAGNTRFGGGTRNNELVLPEPGGNFGLSGYWSGTQPNARRAALEALMNESVGNVIHTSYANQQRSALDLSKKLEAIVKLKPGDAGSSSILNSAFSNLAAPNNTRLAKQLYQVAKMVESGRTALGGTRHIYFVSLGGFDTHSAQLGAHATLMADIGRSVAAFYAALKSMGMADKVTLFTASDFGRTFKPNSSGGTDHAWGNEQLVIGTGVNPKALIGQYPNLTLGGINDAADPTKSWEFQGRWIPSVSVTQYAGSLLKWLNPQANLATVLPGLAAFNSVGGANIGLMKV
jgi:uncharacterized protein (DUF1501 family)